MADSISSRLKKAWNVFTNQSGPFGGPQIFAGSSGTRQDRVRSRVLNDRSIVASVFTRIAIDASSVQVSHARLDDNKRYLENVTSGLNECLTLNANIDQTGRGFIQDLILSMMEIGVVAAVPIDTSDDPDSTGSYNIETIRVGRIVQWYPQHVRVEVYDERNGQRREVVVSKSNVAIIENPLYSVMNEPNSTLQRLIRKLSLLDTVDEVSSSGKLDIIIQLPYVIKSEARKQQAQQRRADLEEQMKGSTYGIGYTDATEKITQLNRATENNMLAQIQYLTTQLYAHLGVTEEVIKGTADEATMLNYYNRTIEPILAAITDEMTRKFLTKTARTQKQAITFIRDPFKLVPLSQIAEIADVFSRNEILSSNELRGMLGFKPSTDPKADELNNSNMPDAAPTEVDVVEEESDEPDEIEAMLDDLDAQIEAAMNGG